MKRFKLKYELIIKLIFLLHTQTQFSFFLFLRNAFLDFKIKFNFTATKWSKTNISNKKVNKNISSWAETKIQISLSLWKGLNKKIITDLSSEMHSHLPKYKLYIPNYFSHLRRNTKVIILTKSIKFNNVKEN